MDVYIKGLNIIIKCASRSHQKEMGQSIGIKHLRNKEMENFKAARVFNVTQSTLQPALRTQRYFPSTWSEVRFAGSQYCHLRCKQTSHNTD
jgi:hypothetical protein